MNMMKNGMSIIPASGANIIARFDDAELVAVLSPSGSVAMFCEDDDILMQVSPWTKSTKISPLELAHKMMAA